ncbi:MAG: EF-P lysine aminoacylase GenX [Gammaproteobacteria bacterium]|nr:MAG: EF-P lysine aminoacylase GenX [Gammaproteobacteria bacterium]
MEKGLPSASIETLQKRALILAAIRSFFWERKVLEVETPVLSQYGTVDQHINSFSVDSGFDQTKRYLHTSPEFAMKRLLAAGSGSIYQICHCFRDGEKSRQHNHEFTMLEWYRTDFSYIELIREVDDLVRMVLGSLTENYIVEKMETECITYQMMFNTYLGINPFSATIEQLQNCASTNNINISHESMGENRDDWLNLLLSHLIEPQLGKGKLTFVMDYPASQAALARISPYDVNVAERFELYIDGVEIANGFQELCDSQEQEQRFIADQEKRTQTGKMQIPYDKNFIKAMSQGLPECSGVALGVDRLVMFALGLENIEEVIPFSSEIA